ncbi:MAG: PCRF domain-containing protein, partial [Alphaproteobacteria bacterium]|nr:PCRF domain-containing protein [Alphaproteobacteria bacterium]
MDFEEKLANVVNRYDEVQALLTSTSSSEELVKLNKELAVLEPVVTAIQNYNHTLQTMRDDEAMMNDVELDKEMRDMAETEYFETKEKLPNLEKEIRVLLLPKDADDEKNAILEVRAGTGGDEAALFAAVLFEMYQRYAQKQGWHLKCWISMKTALA